MRVRRATIPSTEQSSGRQSHADAEKIGHSAADVAVALAFDGGRAVVRLALVPALALLPLLAGCSSIPLPAFTSKISYADVTGSISPPRQQPLSPDLDAEDWRRAKGALALALDPQGNGAPVAWDNPQTKAEGTFIPAGPTYARDGKVCRSFTAKLGGSHPARELQGNACREKDGEWTLGPVTPVKSG